MLSVGRDDQNIFFPTRLSLWADGILMHITANCMSICGVSKRRLIVRDEKTIDSGEHDIDT